MSTVPADAHALAGLPKRHVCADRVYASGDFMSGNSRILNSRRVAFLYQYVAMANSARFNLDADLGATWLRNWTFHHFESGTGFANLNRFHSHTPET